jgi:hypothetical protein
MVVNRPVDVPPGTRGRHGAVFAEKDGKRHDHLATVPNLKNITNL